MPHLGHIWATGHSLHFGLLSELVYLTFSFPKYHRFAAKHASIFSTHFSMVVSNFSFGMHPKVVSVSSITWPSISKFQPRSSHFNDRNNQNLESLFQQSDVFTFDFFISHKILRRNIVWSKHPFSCLRGDTLSRNTHYFHVLTGNVFFSQNWPDTFPLALPMLPNVEPSSYFFVCFFLCLSFSSGVHAILFTKPAVARDGFNVQMSISACWKYNELENISTLSKFS